MYIGIDCGTQGTKAVIVSTQEKKVLGRGYSPHPLIESSQGRREQHPQWWIEALKEALQQAMIQAKINPLDIKGIGISGQQHGLVVLDEQDHVLYPAKLWCDTETVLECQEILAKCGGEEAFFEQTGIQLQTGYTASKLLWLKKHQPECYKKIAKVMLPHDYLNYWLTGQFVTDYGDASGSGYFDIQQRTWQRAVFAQIAPEFDPDVVLPRLIAAQQQNGKIKPSIAKQLNLSTEVVVASGSGDNMMGAIGTGNIKQGVVTMSLGTSGTVYAYTNHPLSHLPSMIANFCSGTNGWLPLICTMNLTSSNQHIMTLLEMDLDKFNQSLEQSTIGAGGITVLPYFNGERVPVLPKAKASILGLDSTNFTPENLCRAVLEGVSFGLRYGLELFQQSGLIPTQIRLIGGGAKSQVWRQILADIMNTEVVCLQEEEAAALGAAIQAMWCVGVNNLEHLCHQLVHLDETTRCLPCPLATAQYQQVYQRYLDYRQLLYPTERE